VRTKNHDIQRIQA